MFESDGDFDIDDAFLEDTFQQDTEKFSHSTLKNETGKRAFSEDEKHLCTKRHRLEDINLSRNYFDDKYHTNLDCEQTCSNRSTIDFQNDERQQISYNSEQTSKKISNQSTPEYHSFATDDHVFSDSISSNEGDAAGLRDASSEGIAAAKLNQKTCRRKFPGPAGLLPDKHSSVLSSKVGGLNVPLLEQPPQEPLCSQISIAVFEEAPWQKMLQDFGLHKKGSSPLEKFTVSWIRRRAAARQLSGQKVPFLAVMLQSIDCSSPDPCLMLSDKTGEIFGTLHRDVWGQYGGQLVHGAVLVLRQTGVLSTGPAARRHYLNITFNNVLTIYTPTEKDDSVKETHLHKVSQKELIDTVAEWQASNIRTARSVAPGNLSVSTNAPQPVGVSLWNMPPSSTHKQPSNRDTSVWLNRLHQESISSSPIHIGLPAIGSSDSNEVHMNKKEGKSPHATFISDKMLLSKSIGEKFQKQMFKPHASNENYLNQIFEPKRTATNELGNASTLKASLAKSLSSFPPRSFQPGSSQVDAFNLKMPVSRDITVTPTRQSIENQKISKFFPKVSQDISFTPARMSTPRDNKFTSNVPNEILLIPVTASLETPKSAKFTPKVPTVIPYMVPEASSSVIMKPVSELSSCSTPFDVNSNTKVPIAAHFSNKSLKENELDTILGGLDTSSLFDDDF